ncbi:MAG TPA: sensor histidine kinase, partial [Firmicutes bacterium]|nr:sensor histidine kinase [Bacillota bacterium]
RQLLRELRAMLGATLSEIAAIARNLRPSVLDDMGLEAAVAKLVEATKLRTGRKLHFSSRGLAGKRFPFYIETAVYRIIQEALTNSIKYAGEASIWVSLDCTGKQLLASVRDNGRGFDPEKVLDGSEPQKGLGLFGMQERAMLTGGTLVIDSAPGLGTTVTVTYPL